MDMLAQEHWTRPETDSVQLVAYPRRGIAYCEELYRAVAELGVETAQGEWGGRWLLQHLRRGSLVHIHWPSFFYYQAGKPLATLVGLLRFVALLILMRLKGARLAWTAHNLYPHDGGRALWVHRVARRFVARMSQTIFVHGPTAAALVADEFNIDPRKLELVPHGHWRQAYPPIPKRVDARRALGLPANAFVYGFVGTTHPYKNVAGLVRAFAEADVDSHLLIAGKSPSRELSSTLRNAIAPHVAGRVHFVDRFLEDDEIMTFVSAVDALVLPYRTILTSGAVMLALSAGVPVVVPRIGGLADVVTRECGILYDAKVPGALAQAMFDVRKRRYKPEEIIAHAMTFDWKDSARKLIDAAARPSPPR